jgi:ParB family chromosome partitioning protein
MARKNLIEISSIQSPGLDTPLASSHRPIAGHVPVVRATSPVGGITKALGNITEKMEHAKSLERQLAQGHTVVELDPALIDGSFVNDRLGMDPAGLEELTEQIRVHGQQVPILVRPHPEKSARFQVAYGHRRLAAVKALGIKVRAVVRVLTDDQLVVSQGQENNARTNLSFIERALFAFRLEERGFARQVIYSALGVDKAALSKMLSIIKKVPMELIVAVGAAPEVGRRRWMELGEILDGSLPVDTLEQLSADNSQALTSNQRFQKLVQSLTKKQPVDPRPMTVETAGDAPVKIKRTRRETSFVFDTKSAPGFEIFVQERLMALFVEFKQNRGQ